MSQQSAAGGSGCCCLRETLPCRCSEMAAWPETLTVTSGATIVVEGHGTCDRRIFGGAGFGTATMLRGPNYSYFSPNLTCGNWPIAGTMSCSGGPCRTVVECGNPQCDDIVEITPIFHDLPWFADTSQTTTGIDPHCSPYPFTYGDGCALKAPGLPVAYQRAEPGVIAWIKTASMQAYDGPCALNVYIRMFMRSLRSITPPTCGVDTTVWYLPFICTTPVGQLFTKICRYPGDTVTGTYRAQGGPVNYICTHYGNTGTPTYTMTVNIPDTITVS